MRLLTVILFVGGLLLTSCDNDDMEMNSGNLNVQFTAVSAAAGINNGRMLNDALSYDRVLVGLTEIELEMEDDDDDDDDSSEELEYEGNYTVDLLAGTSNPSPNTVSIEPGTYNEIEIEFEDILEGGYSVVMDLVYAPNGGSGTPVEFRSEEDYELELEDDITINAGDVKNLILTLDLDRVFNGINFSRAELTDGTIRVDEENNTALLDAIESNIKDALDSDSDDDDDDDDD
jgi:hypothetical protein